MTGTPHTAILDMDGMTFAAYRQEAEEAEWGVMAELVAVQTEILHGIWRMMIGAFTKARAPDPLQIPRPGQDMGKARPNRIVVKPGEFAQMMRGRR